ncbi:MAG: two component LuxR family transcriptional regulator [Chthonomonadaceae bacterium]|nr:two component LuxR family transcriptional regulator [Chthonomonadaceae bacterium]
MIWSMLISESVLMSPLSLIRMLVADDHPIIREGLCGVIRHHKSICVVGEAGDGQEAIDLYRIHLPDIVLMDLFMPRMNGLQATHAIMKEFPQARIIILSISDRDETVYQTMRAGAKAYLCKDTPIALFFQTVEAVFAGQTCLPMDLAAKLAGRLNFSNLTPREQEVLEHIVSGKSNREIGAVLFIGEGTVKSHVNKILDKLHVTDRTQAAVTALKRGLVLLDSTPEVAQESGVPSLDTTGRLGRNSLAE